ncbi:MAG TPA: carbohydrate ABC transporter permease [Kribbella sp.]|uniref:carbohydrate ABC transporter permease n=1 Tax=Kribbella sp. TaxID=1871183 RepID=UPI002D7A3FD2|nr:carbohydrate ABC transporter permease [Kribbella sp.]HET6294543.1 carbohydrate ABC transporter permease [Kribbella sp.]
MSTTDARPVWAGKPSVPTRVIKAIVLIVVAVVVLFPFLVVVSTSLASQADLTANGGFMILPDSFTFEAYRAILSGGVVTKAVLVSVFVTVVGTTLSLICTTLAAYGLTRRDSFGHRPILTFFLLTFLFTPGIIPSYLMVKQLGLIDNVWALILPSAISAFNLVIVRGFFMGIPEELLDAARIDGAGEWRIFATIVVPLSRAVLAVVGLFYAVGYWNAFFNAMLYLNDTTRWPLQLVVRTYVLQGNPILDASGDAGSQPPTQAVQMAVAVLALLPIAMIFPFLQRNFTKGVLTGAIKG